MCYTHPHPLTRVQRTMNNGTTGKSDRQKHRTMGIYQYQNALQHRQSGSGSSGNGSSGNNNSNHNEMSVCFFSQSKWFSITCFGCDRCDNLYAHFLSICTQIQSTTSHMTSLVYVYFANTATLVVDYIALYVHTLTHTYTNKHSKQLDFHCITSTSISVFIYIINMRE